MATSKYSADLLQGMRELLREGHRVTWECGADSGAYVLSIVRDGDDDHGYGSSMEEAREDLRRWPGGS